jgi:hypothetical protein
MLRRVAVLGGLVRVCVLWAAAGADAEPPAFTQVPGSPLGERALQFSGRSVWGCRKFGVGVLLASLAGLLAFPALSRAQAQTTLTTTPSPAAVIIGSGVRLGDTAVLAGGFDPTGTITFTLLRAGTVVDTEPVTITANGSYTTPTGYLPTVTGTYQWDASYSGDSNNNAASDTNDPSELAAALTPPGGSTTTATLAVSTAFSEGGRTVSLSATVDSSAGTVTEGAVTFMLLSGSTVIGSPTTGTVSGGQTTVSYTLPAGTAAGTYTINADYADSNAIFTASSDSTQTLTVTAAATTIAASSATAGFDASAQNVGLSAAVTSPAGTVSEGAVTFTLLHGSTAVGSPTTGTVSNGQASVSYGLPPGTVAGTYTIKADYADPTGNFVDSADTTQTLTVTPAVVAPPPTISGPPTATINFPATGGSYSIGQVVPTGFSCAEGTGGPGLFSCRDSNGANAPAGTLNTSKPGTFTYTVTATSKDGQTATASVSYTVAAPPTAAIKPPSNQIVVSHIKTHPDGTITLQARVPGPGSVGVLETAWDDNLAHAAVLIQPARNRFVYARAEAVATSPGILHLRIRPNARGLRLVHHHTYPVVLRLWVTYTPTGGTHRSFGFYGLHLPK